MELAAAITEQLAAARRIVAGGNEVIPAWRVRTSEGDYLLLTRFDPDDDKQRLRLLHLVGRFLAWKMALSFIVSGECWLGPAGTRDGLEAVFSIGVTRSGSTGLLQTFTRSPLKFDEVQTVPPSGIDQTYIELMPRTTETISDDEARELTQIFGSAGEVPARRL